MCSSLIGIGLRVRNVLADVVFDQFSGQPSDSTPNRCDQVQDLTARGVAFQRSFHSLDLSLKPSNAGEQLVFVLIGMAHNIGGYPIFAIAASLRFGALDLPIMGSCRLDFRLTDINPQGLENAYSGGIDREKMMSGILRFQNWIMLTVALLAMTLLFASTQSHAGPPPCPSQIVHAGGENHIQTDGQTDMDHSATHGCCAQACTLCPPSFSVMSLLADQFERALVPITACSPLHGQIPSPGRHPPRTAV
jgi:hypothetical protein